MDLIKPGRPPHSPPRVRRFALKVQQFTGPMMAKSLEDTAFYRYHRLLALNEVGGDPSARRFPSMTFTGTCETRASEWPHGMTATATHDTKRGEDARARILALAEIPDDGPARWRAGRSSTRRSGHRRRHARARRPTFEYMLYQALIGAWPAGAATRHFVGADAGLCAQGGARGQAGDQLAQSRRGL